MKRIFSRLMYITSMITLPAFIGVAIGAFFFHKESQEAPQLGYFLERASADVPNSGCTLTSGEGGGDGTCGAAGDGTCGE